MIVATARMYELALMTIDEKIVAYPHVSLVTV
jgi:PIN domain nuclease of toxin-antitoxin system